jgi:anaerobic selenocysteine-containing dehydrogenase
VQTGLRAAIDEHGKESIATYLGNPTAHSLDTQTFIRVLLRAIGSRQRYSAATVDQAPKQVASGYLFGSAAAVAIPDIDRTDFLLILGANPLVSNGSLCVAPDWPGRMKAIRARGGKIVTVDPRRTRTAVKSDEWIGIRPATDAAWLLSLIHVIFAEQLADPGERLTPYLAGLAEIRALSAEFSPAVTERYTSVSAEVTTRLAREFAAAKRAVAYGRMGTTTTRFGTITSWLIDVLNTITGNLDEPGGAMFARPAIGGLLPAAEPGGRGFAIGRSRTRVRGLPEVLGEFPVAALAEEITTPGPGQVRTLITVAGNPVSVHSRQRGARSGSTTLPCTFRSGACCATCSHVSEPRRRRPRCARSWSSCWPPC